MERRTFLRSCAFAGGAAGLTQLLAEASAAQPFKAYSRALLVDEFGAAIKTRDLVVNRNYLFKYPYAGTPYPYPPPYPPPP